MHDARDAEDRRLLDEKNHKQLLAGYFHLVRERCFLRLRKEDAADDAAQQVFERLLKELRAGKTYPVPYRIVVALVTDWTLRGFYPQPKQDAPLPDDVDTAWAALGNAPLTLARAGIASSEMRRQLVVCAASPPIER